jgi:uncharacterized protein YhjY with autotransporter beta-barrel domain
MRGEKRLSLQLVIVVAMSILLIDAQMPAVSLGQVLDRVIEGFLANNCLTLTGGGGGGTAQPLAGLCAAGPGATSTGPSAGGGASTVQGSAVSILNRRLVQRLEETKAEDGQGRTPAASLQFNPVGAFFGVGGLGSGASAPSMQTGGSTGGTVNLGTTSRWHGLGFFGSGVVEALNRNVSTFQDGYLSTILGLTGGADYRFSREVVAGAAFSYSNTNGSFTNGGSFSTNGYSVTMFGSYAPTDKSFAQVSGGYTYNDHNVDRAINVFIAGTGGGPDRIARGFASSDTTSDVFNFNLLMGYDQPVGMFTIGPRLGLNYANTHIHDYTEQGSTGVELKLNDQWVNSLQSTLGVQGQAAISTGFGVLVPQFNADYIHEFANSQRFLTARFAYDVRATPTFFTFQNEVPVRNYFNVGTGLQAVLPNGLQPFVNFRAMVGNNQFDNYAGTFGLRVEM